MKNVDKSSNISVNTLRNENKDSSSSQNSDFHYKKFKQNNSMNKLIRIVSHKLFKT